MASFADRIWNILNTHRTKHFLTEPKALIDVESFDVMMDEIGELLLDAEIHKHEMTGES